MNNTLTTDFLKKFTKGKIFSAHYIKKSTQKMASMTIRCGVKKGQKGGKQTYNPAARNHLTVFKMGRNGGYRMLVMDNLLAITFRGRTYSRMDLLMLQDAMNTVKVQTYQVQEFAA